MHLIYFDMKNRVMITMVWLDKHEGRDKGKDKFKMV